MSLSQRQRDRALTLALRSLLRRGTPPDLGEVDEEFIAELPEILGEPFFRLREQARRGAFRLDWQNAMFRETHNDLQLVYEQDVAIVETLLGHLALAEIAGGRAGQEIRSLQGLLENLLLTAQRGTNFFRTVFDSFVDLSKTDQVQSDVAADLATGILTLAPEASTRRLPMAHLLGQVNAPVQVLTPRTAQTRLIPGSRFGNAFEDLLTAWQQEVLTDTQEPVEIVVTIPVIDLLNQAPPVEITRITLHALSATPFTVLPLWARDGVAFSQFDNFREPVRVEDDVAVLDVTPQTVTAIQLRLRKTGPDGEDELPLDPSVGTRQRRFHTTFGFRQIGIWQMGFKRHGVFISKTLTPEDDESISISKVSLTVDEVVPPGTSIRYAVAPASAPTSFLPITPSNRQDSEAPKVIDFQTTQRSTREENVFTISTGSPPTSLGTIRGTEFWNLRGVTDPAIFQSARLWRGKQAWHCRRALESTVRSIRNLFLDFANSDVVPLYVFEEDERIATHPSNDGTQQIEIGVRYPILLDSDEFQPGQDLQLPSDVARPSYSIRRLLRRPVTGTVSSTQATGALTITSRAQRALVENQSQQTAPTAGRTGAEVRIATFSGAQLTRLPTGGAGPIPDLVDVQFRLSYVVNSVTIAGTFTTLAAQLESDGTLVLKLDDPTEVIQTASGTLVALTASWEFLTVNITGSISDVIGSRLRLDRTQKLDTNDLLEITYRRKLLPAESPITASLVLKDGSDNTVVFREGRDYTIDAGSRTVARIPTGRIGVSGDQSALSVRADFDFEEQLLGLVTYRTFLFNSQPTPKLTIEQIVIDREHGEEILLETSQGFLDLNEREEIPPLPAGWHQVVVRSDPVLLPDGTVNTDSAIYKAINLREIRTPTDAGRFLLPAQQHPAATAATTNAFANYFTRQVAFLQPMQQVTFQQLTASVRATDRAVFAIKTATEAPATATAALVVNFDPRTAEDLLYFPPDLSGTGIPLSREDFEFEYAFTPAAVSPLTGLVLRATLERDPDAEGSLTPILKSYTLRMSV